MCVSTDRSPRSRDLSTVSDRENTVIVALNLTGGSVGESSFFLFGIVLGISFWPAVQMFYQKFQTRLLNIRNSCRIKRRGGQT